VATDPDTIFAVLKNHAPVYRGSTTRSDHCRQRGFPAICWRLAWAGAVGDAQEDRQGGCARTAHIMRTGWFREVPSRNLKLKFLDIAPAVRHSIKTFGLKVGRIGRGRRGCASWSRGIDFRAHRCKLRRAPACAGSMRGLHRMNIMLTRFRGFRIDCQEARPPRRPRGGARKFAVNGCDVARRHRISLQGVAGVGRGRREGLPEARWCGAVTASDPRAKCAAKRNWSSTDPRERRRF